MVWVADDGNTESLLLLGITACSDGWGSVAVGSGGCVGGLDLALGGSILDAVGCVFFVAVTLGRLLLGSIIVGLWLVLGVLLFVSRRRIVLAGGLGLALL